MSGGDGVLLVKFAALQQASSDIQAAINSMTTQLSDLDSAAKPLVATWSGDAKQAYEQRQATWNSAANDLNQILTNVKKALDDSIADYAQTEKSNAALFGG